MQDIELKQKVINEIMGLMDEAEGNKLKKHPKLQPKAPADPVAEEANEVDEFEEGPEDVEESETSEDGEMSPEMVEKILEMYEDIK